MTATLTESEILSQPEKDVREAEEKAQNNKGNQENDPKNAQQWLGNVESALRKALPHHQYQELQQLFASARALSQVNGEQQALGKKVRNFVEELELTEVEKLLEQLKALPEAVKKADTNVAKEVVLYERQLKEVAKEKELLEEAHGESIIRRSDLQASGSLQEEVFGNFAKFLSGKNAKIIYEGNKLSIERTAEGGYIIYVPEASFENMIQVARTISKDAFNNKVGIKDMPEQLKTAALIMEKQAIFSSSAIAGLYNAGVQLEKALNNQQANPSDTVSIDTIQKLSRKFFGEDRTNEVMSVYLHIFLGKHDATLIQDEDNRDLHIQKSGRGTLYDALFESWKKSDEGKAVENAGKFANPQDPEAKAEIIKAYDAWLSDPKRQYSMMHRLKPFIEESSVLGGRYERRYGVLIAQWRKMLLDTSSIKKISGEINNEIGTAKLQIDQLRTINKMFQPNGKVPPGALKHLPSDVLAIFSSAGSTSQQRNEAACVIADSYIKTILQERGFSVFTNLKGRHTRLVAVSKTDGKAYFVDPNAPAEEDVSSKVKIGEKGDTSGIVEIKKEGNEELLRQLRTVTTREGKVIVDTKHGVNFTTEKDGIIADGNGLLTSGFLSNMIEVANPPLSKDAKFAAAERAVALFPDNPVAWLRLAQQASGDRQKQYFEQAQRLDPSITQESFKELKIGAWAVTPTGNPAIDAIVTRADAYISATRGATLTSGLEVLTLDQLRMLNLFLENVVTPGMSINDLEAITDRRQQVELAISAKARDDRVSVFYLSQSEQAELARKDTQGVLDFIEIEISKFAPHINPGAFVPQGIAQEMQSRFRDITTLLSARTPDDKIGGHFPKNEKEEVLEFLRSINEMFEAAPKVAGLIESGNPKYQENAAEHANQMDEQGGLNVLHTMYSFHEGRPGSLVSDVRREMRKAMRENFYKKGSFFIKHEEYLRLSETIIPQQLNMARAGIGQYAEKFGVLINPARPDLGFTPESLENIRAQIDMDLRFARLIFTITGEASALYIRGRLPDGTFDPGATSFLNAEWQDAQRYGVITPSNKKVARHQFGNVSSEHLKKIFGEPVARSVMKNDELFERYIAENGVDLLAPEVNMWWENRFVRTIKMVGSLNAYEKAQDERNRLAGLDRWRGGYVEPGEKAVKNAEDYENIPMGGDPEFGIMLRAFLYEGSISSESNETLRILRERGTDYFPDIIMEAFSYNAGSGRGNKLEGIPADTRFINFLMSGAANFLGNRNPGESDYDFAVRRFNVFQDQYKPVMDAIRAKRINFVDRTNPHHLIANPRQTDFAATRGPQSAVADVDAAFGANAAAFRTFIHEMQQTIRNTGMAETLAKDPMFENQWHSPMTLVDVPQWMLDGKDLAGKEHTDPLHVKLGANNRLGRYIGDVPELGTKTRAGLIHLLKANPNNTGEVFKIINEMSDGIKATRGVDAAWEVTMNTVAEYMNMMLPGTFTDILGLQGLHLSKNTEYRKIMGELVNALSREEVFSLVEGSIMPGLSPDHRKRLRAILRISTWNRKKRQAGQTLFMLLLSSIFQTTGSVMGVLNEGITKGAA